MKVILVPLLEIVYYVLDLYVILVVIAVMFDWLRAFNVINFYNRFVWAVGIFLGRLTLPCYRLIRRVIPPFGGLDLSPFVLILIVYFLRGVVAQLLMRLHT